ncbi:MAG: hypothetical protein EA409_02695 [Saprospirales bacterium]|nr:MAG: hypothetical protein EA409_02695 [Saprospirales bacterium]
MPGGSLYFGILIQGPVSDGLTEKTTIEEWKDLGGQLAPVFPPSAGRANLRPQPKVLMPVYFQK